MSPWSSTQRILWTTAALVLLLVRPLSAADAVGSWLEARGLTDLLTAHLEQQLALTTGEEKTAVATQLARLYATLHASASEADDRADLERRGRRVLGLIPSARVTDELRLELSRGTFLAVEQASFAHRLQIDSEVTPQVLRSMLDDTIRDLVAVRRQFSTRRTSMQRRLANTGGSRAAALETEVDRLGQLEARSTFLAAWSLYHRAHMVDSTADAEQAQAMFEQLIRPGGDGASLAPSAITEDHLEREGVARSILGFALCQSITASPSETLTWLDLLERPKVPQVVREAVPVWTLIVALEDGQFARGERMIRQRLDAGATVPDTWYRILAIHAIGGDAPVPGNARLVRWAVTELAANGALEMVYDLVQRYGIETLGESGFAVRYVEGVRTYQEARSTHGQDEPTEDAELTTAYERSLGIFREALDEGDVDAFPTAAAGCRHLEASCLWFLGRFKEAALAYESVADRLPGDQEADALWMAIVSLDRADSGGAASLGDDRDRLETLFVERFPGDPRVSQLAVRRASQAREATPALVEELLLIPPGDAAYPGAQQRASLVLFELFREAQGETRTGWASRYLTVAVPLIVEDAASGDAGVARRCVAQARRVLEVALSPGVGRLVAAAAALELIEQVATDHALDLAEAIDELDYRRVQLHSMGDAHEQAEARAEALATRNPASPWVRASARLLYRAGRARREAAGGIMDPGTARLIATWGRRVLDEQDDLDAAMEDPGLLTCAVDVAAASLVLWRRSRDADLLRETYDLHGRILVLHPRHRASLRGRGELAEAMGEQEEALRCWRLLLKATASDDADWFEAKYHQISILAESDPDRARAIMDQHRLLNPSYGPAPWGSRLRTLDARLTGEATS